MSFAGDSSAVASGNGRNGVIFATSTFGRRKKVQSSFVFCPLQRCERLARRVHASVNVNLPCWFSVAVAWVSDIRVSFRLRRLGRLRQKGVSSPGLLWSAWGWTVWKGQSCQTWMSWKFAEELRWVRKFSGVVYVGMPTGVMFPHNFSA